MNPKIVAVCGAHTASGGPEAVHQLVDMANQIESGSAAICYVPCEQKHSVTREYQSYNIPTITKKDIPDKCVVILPESLPGMVSYFHQRCALWWLSVDNFGLNEIHTLDKFIFHLSQSYYSSEFVNNLGFKTHNLSDYINEIFIDDIRFDKQKNITTNPAKGINLINNFMSKNPNINTIFISGMSKEEIKKVLQESMIYIDFGHHPGKDRIPREAALAGAIVLAHLKGSAKNSVDIPIDDFYKFDNIEVLSEKINNIFADYEFHKNAQVNYCEIIKQEKETFKQEVINLLNIVKDLN
jgi:hypothetical protein